VHVFTVELPFARSLFELPFAQIAASRFLNCFLFFACSCLNCRFSIFELLFVFCLLLPKLPLLDSLKCAFRKCSIPNPALPMFNGDSWSAMHNL